MIGDACLVRPAAQSYLRWVPYDGIGRNVRNGLNFTERGFGIRGAVGCSDRGHTAVSLAFPQLGEQHNVCAPVGVSVPFCVAEAVHVGLTAVNVKPARGKYGVIAQVFVFAL